MYENYLFNLNEMYYGKHPLLKMIEKYFNEIKNIINDSRNNNLGQIFKREVSEDEIPEDVRKRLLKNKEQNSRKLVDDDYVKRALRRRYGDNFELEDLKESTRYLKKQDSKYGLIHEYVKHIIRTSNTARIALHDPLKLKEPTEEDLKQYGYVTVMNNILGEQGLMSGYFEPTYNYEYYSNLVKNICEAWMAIFKFPGATLDIIISPLVNAFYFPGISVFNDTRLLNFAKNSKSIALNKWIYKNKLNAFESNNSSIYLKKYSKDPAHIFITTTAIQQLNPDIIVAMLLHEIGHYFGYRLLPIEYYTNTYIQEKFADAFATKFGYGMELIQGLRYLQSSMNMQYIMLAYNNAGKDLSAFYLNNDPEIDGYLKLKILLNSLLSKYDNKEAMRGGYRDPHPTHDYRYKEQLENLIIELDNPRLNNLQKRQLKNDIEKVKKELSPKEQTKIEKFMQDVEYEMNIASIGDEYKAKIALNPKIIRDILDRIYDESMR